ncbi:MAG TPA: ATP-binding protein [Bryobacteraceae bacterium]|nr:ATP-binding protein [Bryobacteraceae bacterium]
MSNLATMQQSATESVPAESLALLDAFPLPAALVDRHGQIRYVNRAWQGGHPAGFYPGAMYVRACARHMETNADGIAGLEDAIRHVRAGKQEGFAAVFPCPAENGRVRVNITPARLGGFDGVLVTHQTVSPAAESDDRRRRQAEKMEAVGRLVGGVAHDFANLLTLISGYSELMLNRMEPEEPLRKELEEIRKAANRGSRLTAQLLGFTRGQAVEPKILDLNGLIRDMQNMLRPIIGEYVELTTDLAPDLGRIKADPGQMEQVIMNLVLNARDAMPSGGRIGIETANIELNDREAAAHEVAAGPYVVLSFCDTGQGMDSQTMSHLFEPFFTTKEKGKGTGLGLSTVYGIVKQNRGDVWARSVPGEGTTFTICLPRLEPSGENAEPAAASRASAKGTETILLVEDEEGVRRLLKHILSRQGYTVLEADGGRAALELLAGHQGPIHLLLTDMVMPHINGREVAQRCMQMRPGTRVIYMSGYTDDVLLRTGALGPGMSFLQKPLRPDVLTGKVREVLDGPGAQV